MILFLASGYDGILWRPCISCMETYGIFWDRFKQPEWKKSVFSDGSFIFNPFLRRLQGAEGGHKGLGFNLSQLASCWSDLLFEKWGSEPMYPMSASEIRPEIRPETLKLGVPKNLTGYIVYCHVWLAEGMFIAVRWWTSSGKKLVDLLQTLKKCQWHNIFWN